MFRFRFVDQTGAQRFVCKFYLKYPVQYKAKTQGVLMAPDKSSDEQDSVTFFGKIKQIATLLGTILGVVGAALVIIQGVGSYLAANKKPTVIINNHLALPVIVTINDSATYTYRVEAQSIRTIQLLSQYDFPVKIDWHVIRNKNAGGQEMGEPLSGTYAKVDKENIVNIVSNIGSQPFFYPIINNNTNQKCLISINDGLTTGHVIGVSNPHHKTNITGYFKYAKNTNITLYCDNVTYWRGTREGKKDSSKLKIQSQSGIMEVSFP